MNIGLLIRGGQAALKASKEAAKKAAKTKAGKKVVGAAKKTAENVGYAATPGLKRGARGSFTKSGRRGFIPKSEVQKTGAKVIGGGAAIGTGAAGAKVVSGRRKRGSAAKPAPSKPAATSGKAPIKFGTKTAAKKAAKVAKAPAKKKASPAGAKPKALEKRNKGTAAKTFAVAQAKKKAVKKAAPRGASAVGSRFDNMTKAKIKKLRGKDKIQYNRYLARKNK